MVDKFAESKGAVARTNQLSFDPKALTIVTDKNDPLYDPRCSYEVPEWLVDSIIEHGGVHTPVVVMRDGTDKNGAPIVKVVEGRLRVRACIEANKRMKKAGKEPFTVPTTMKVLSEDRMADLVIVLNEHRVADVPSVRAEKMVQMRERGRTNADIGRAFRVSAQTVASYLKLAETSAAVQKAVDRGELPLSTATSLAELPRAEQTETAKRMIAEGTVRGKAGKEAAAEALGPRPPKERRLKEAPSPAAVPGFVVPWSEEEVALVDKALDYAHEKTEGLDAEDYESGFLFGVAEVFRFIRSGRPGAKALADALYASTNQVMEDAGVETEEGDEDE